jgi:predicted nucleotidyltransferase
MAPVANWTEHFFDAFARWAEARGDIVGAAVVGSFARGTASPTSDIDLVVLTTVPAEYLAHTEWTSAFGIVQREEREDWGAVRALRVWYLGGREVEYGFTLPAWASIPPNDGTRIVARGGIRVLFDRQGVLDALCREIATGCQ